MALMTIRLATKDSAEGLGEKPLPTPAAVTNDLKTVYTTTAFPIEKNATAPTVMDS
ncbi:MAG: hypothetical protein ACYS9T_05555 [Planctomycetota bacterium]|jgi:hypothetical protein